MDYIYLLVIKLISAVLLIQILGMFWYSDKLFGKTWKKELGIKKNQIELNKKFMKRNLFVSTISNLILVFVLTFIFSLFYYVISLTLIVSAILWIAFVLTTSINSVLWEGRSVKIYLINNFYYLVSFILVALIASI